MELMDMKILGFVQIDVLEATLQILPQENAF